MMTTQIDRRSQGLLRIAMALVGLLLAVPAHAHHEAIFGPQSSSVLSAERFASAQIFTREVGSGEDRARQTTVVLSGGLQPTKRPLSIAVVLPVSFVGATPAGGSRKGLEDVLVSARYRFESARLTDALNLDESYVMTVGGVEIPTGTFDHEFGRGAVGGIAAALLNVERRPFSAIGYGYYHHTGVYRGTRESGNVFVGVGGAWTPIDNLQTGRLVSFQVGMSHERTFAPERNGAPLVDSGGSGVFVHQGLVWGANEHMQFFTLLSLPVTQQWNAVQDRQRFRLGAGAILLLSH